jgi:hypothetical protein
MFRSLFNPQNLPPGEVMRREHSRWLTAALAGRAILPRIPTRRVNESKSDTPSGGFSTLMSLPSGPKQAERWWNLVLARVARSPDDLQYPDASAFSVDKGIDFQNRPRHLRPPNPRDADLDSNPNPNSNPDSNS